MAKELYNFTRLSVAELEKNGYNVDPRGLLFYNGNKAKVELRRDEDGGYRLGNMLEEYGDNQFEVFKSLYNNFDDLFLVEENLLDAIVHIDENKLSSEVWGELWDKIYDATKRYIMYGDKEILKETQEELLKVYEDIQSDL